MNYLVFIFLLVSQIVNAVCTEATKDHYKSSIEWYKLREQCYEGYCVVVRPSGRVEQFGEVTGIFWEVVRIYSSGEEAGLEGQFFYTCSNYPEISSAPPPPVTCAQSGSVIHPQTQVLGEELPIVGAPFQLNYFTNRVKGKISEYGTVLRLTEGFVYEPVSLVSLVVKDIHDQIFHQSSLNYILNDLREFSWTPTSTDYAGKKFITLVGEIYVDNTQLNYQSSFILGNFRAEVLGLGGWYPSHLYFYGHETKQLYKPDGTILEVQAQPGPGASEFYVASEDGDVVYIFNEVGFHKRTVTNLTGANLVSFQYNSNWTLDRITERSGRYTQFNRDSLGKLTNITTSTGKVTNVTLTTDGYLSSITDPLGKTYTMTYQGSGGILSTFQKPTLEMNTFTYDVFKNLIKDEHSGGKWSTLMSGTNAQGNFEVNFDTRMGQNIKYTSQSPSGTAAGYGTSSVSDNKGSSQFSKTLTSQLVTTSIFSTNSQVADDSRFKDQVRNVTSFYDTYKGVGKTDHFTETSTLNDPNNPWSILTYQKTRSYYDSTASYIQRITNSVYNPSAKTWTTTSPMGRTTATVFDNDERVTSLRKGSLHPITYTYEMDQIKTESHTSARVTTYNYNSTTRLLTSILNPLNQSTYFSYDNNERLIAQTFPDLKVVQYTYDDLGRVIGITPPSRPQHVFSFNSQEQLGSYLAPTQMQGTGFIYDYDNRLISKTKPSGTVISYTYDPTYFVLNQISSPTTSITYTRSAPTWNPSSIAHSGGFNITQTFSGVTLDTQSLYDPASSFLGSMQTIYNDRSLIASQVLTNKDNTTYAVNRSYNADELLTQVGSMTLGYTAMPNGILNKTTIQTLVENITSSLFEEVTNRNVKKSTTTYFSEDLIRDPLGRITQRVMAVSGWPTSTYNYVYDTRGRLTEVQDAGLSWIRRYTYDDNGNRLSVETASPASTVLSTTNSQDQLTSSGVYTYTYNLNGELQTKTNTFLNQTATYVYDDFGNLTQVTLENGDVINYEVDGLNRRVGRKKNNVLIERYLWNENQLIAELNPNGSIKRRYIYVTKSHSPDYYVEGTTNYKIVSDSIGSPVLVLKASDGAVIQRVEYDEFGRVIQDTRSGELAIGFAGGVSDWDTKLVRFGARDYDASTGRWTTKDPILFEGGDANLYGYVENDPVNWIDPEGMSKFSDKRSPLFNGGGYPGGGGRGGAVGGGGTGRPFNANQRAAIDLAKQAERRGSINRCEAEQLVKWGNEYKVPNTRIDSGHPTRNTNFPHFHLGPVDHVPIK